MKRLNGIWMCLALFWAAMAAQARTMHFYYTDPQGTVLAKTDAQGNILARYDYKPYGGVVSGQGPNGPGYTGHENDTETGLVYMQARYYDPVGRFLSPDPVTPSAGALFRFNRYDYANNNPIGNIDPDGRKTTCTGSGNDRQCTITADTYKPATSTHQTIVATPAMRAAANQGKSVVAVHYGTQEKLGFIVKGADGKLTVQNANDTATGQTATGSTASATIPPNAVAGIHGHIDSGPYRSNGMVDDPASNGGYGDTQSLKAGIPMATVSHGQVGWHEMQNGQLEFTYPGGALNGSQNYRMQTNLNVEQLNFEQAQQ